MIGALGYYERWAVVFANLLFQKGVLTPEEVALKMAVIDARSSAERGDDAGEPR
jgi:hypothetical protein